VYLESATIVVTNIFYSGVPHSGAATLGITTLGIMTLSITITGIMTFSITTLGNMTLSITTFNITIKTFGFSKQRRITLLCYVFFKCDAECHYTEFCYYDFS